MLKLCMCNQQRKDKSMVTNMRKKLGIASLVALMALATGPVAEAASFSSTFTGVRNGYKSRVWHDGGGSSQTTVRTSRCSVDHAQGNLDLTLWRHLLSTRSQPRIAQRTRMLHRYSTQCMGWYSAWRLLHYFRRNALVAAYYRKYLGRILGWDINNG